MIGLQVEDIVWYIGKSSLLRAFFSTVSYRLETDGWGSRFPVLLRGLYKGMLPAEKIPAALDELDTIHDELADYSLTKVVWDIYDLDKLPPVNFNPPTTVSNLSEYFTTEDGKDLIAKMHDAFIYAKDEEEPVVIRSGIILPTGAAAA
jgi:2,3-bisphosphoglycerate-dependent phosphoglycerate mutase